MDVSRTKPCPVVSANAQAQGTQCQSFTELCRQHYAGMLRVAFRVLHDWHDAEDAVQEAMLRAAFALSSFSGRARFSTWLYRITVREAINILRRERRQRRSWPCLAAQLSEYDCDPEDDVIRADIQELVRQGMGHLDAHRRMLLHLRYHRECTNAEIATYLGCPEGTVKSQLYRARRSLAPLLEEVARG